MVGASRMRTWPCRRLVSSSWTWMALTTRGPGTRTRSWLSRGCPCHSRRMGGRHCIFRQPPGRHWGSTASKIAPKVDTRGNGGYIVLPPSVVEGKRYRWGETSALVAPGELPEPPGWLTAILDGWAARATARHRGGPGRAQGATGRTSR